MKVTIDPLNRRRAGFSLTELAMVLGVVGILIGAVWTAAANVKNNTRAEQAAQDIMQIAANLRATYSGANSFPATWSGTDQTSTMIAAGILPTDLLTAAGGTMNAWQGTVAVYIAPPLASNLRIFRVSFYNTPADACFRIASQLANLGTNDGPVNLITGANGSGIVAINTTGTTIGLSSATITAQCALNTFGHSSTEFDFKIH